MSHAEDAGLTLNPFGANVWTGARETVKNGSLYGQPVAAKNLGDSKGLADYFTDLVNEKALQMNISPQELERLLSEGRVILP